MENGGEWVYNNIIVPVQSFAEEVAEDIDNFDIENIIQVCLGNMTQICEAVYRNNYTDWADAVAEVYWKIFE